MLLLKWQCFGKELTLWIMTLTLHFWHISYLVWSLTLLLLRYLASRVIKKAQQVLRNSPHQFSFSIRKSLKNSHLKTKRVLFFVWIFTPKNIINARFRLSWNELVALECASYRTPENVSFGILCFIFDPLFCNNLFCFFFILKLRLKCPLAPKHYGVNGDATTFPTIFGIKSYHHHHRKN